MRARWTSLLALLAVSILTLLAGCPRPVPPPAPIPRSTQAGPFEIEYAEAGQGPALVLIHGFGDSLQTWEPVWEHLSEQFHVYAYNTLGVGASDNPLFDSDPVMPPSGQPDNPWPRHDLGAYLAQLSAFLDQQGVDRALLVGHSMGAQIALSFAAEYPERVAGFAVLNPTGASPVGPEMRRASLAMVDFARTEWTPVTRMMVRRVLEELVVQDALVDEELVARSDAHWASAPGRRALFNTLLQFRCIDPHHRYDVGVNAWRARTGQDPGHRALVIWGEEDPWALVEGAVAYAEVLEGAEVLLVPETGHLPQLEQPDLVAGAIVGVFSDPDSGRLVPHRLHLDQLIEATDGEPPSRAAYAAGALGRSGDPRAAAPLLGLLDHPVDQVRRWAVAGLVALGEVDALVEVLGDSGQRDAVRKLVAEALVEVGGPQATRALLEATADPGVGYDARRSLARGGAGVVEPLIEALGDPDADLRRRAVEALGRSGDPRAFGPLLDAYGGDLDRDVRTAVVVAFGDLGDPRAVPILVERLGATPSGRVKTVRALAALGEESVGPVGALVEHEEAEVRRAALDVLARVGEVGDVDRVIGLLADEEPEVRSQAARALGEDGDAQAVPALVALLEDDAPGVRLRAAAALGAIGDRRAVEPLVDALSDREGMVRHAAAEALVALPAPYEPLATATRDEDVDVRKAAVRALGTTGDPAAVPALSAALSDPDPFVRAHAASSLGSLGSTEAVEPLIAALSDADWDVVAAAAGSLGQIGDRRAIEPLLDTFSTDAAIAASDEIALSLAVLTGAWRWEEPELWRALVSRTDAPPPPER